MTVAEWQERLVQNNAVCRSNKIYKMIFWHLDKTEIMVEQIYIEPEYRGRGYLKRIFTNLCKEFNSSLVFECYGDLRPMYEHIGAFTMTPRYYGLIEMYFDPLGINY
jgi:hypothetical protein